MIWLFFMKAGVEMPHLTRKSRHSLQANLELRKLRAKRVRKVFGKF